VKENHIIELVNHTGVISKIAKTYLTKFWDFGLKNIWPKHIGRATTSFGIGLKKIGHL